MPNPDSFDSSSPQEFSSSGSKIGFREVVQLIYDKFWLIVSCVATTLFLAALYLVITPRIYEGTATIQVEQADPVFVKGAAEGNLSEEQTEAIDNTVASKFNDYDLLKTVLVENNILTNKNITPGSAMAVAQDRTIKGFDANVKVSTRRNTRLIDIAVRNVDPRMAAQLANSLVQNYVKKAALVQEAAAENDSAILREQADRFKQKLEAADQSLQDYRKQIGMVSLDQSQDIITPQLQDIGRRLTQSKAELVLAQGAYQDSLKMPTNIDGLLAYPEIVTNLDVAQINDDIARLDSEFAVIRQRYREKNPKYILAQSSINGLKEQLAVTAVNIRSRIQENMRLTYENALTAEQGLETQLHETEAQALKLSDSAVRFDVLSREVQSDKALYDDIVTRLGETTAPGQIGLETVRIIQPASVPNIPVSPKKAMVLILGMFLGVCLSGGLIFILKSSDTSFQGADEAEQYLGMPVLGLIPKLNNGKENEFAAIIDLQSAKIEGFHALRANLSMLGFENTRKTYLFTSALPDEGKTFASANYAASLAQQGLRTLLIDLDLRCPAIEKALLGNDTNLSGVVDYFSGKATFNQLCQPHPAISKLFWMPAGSLVPNPTELLLHANFQKLLDEALQNFDRIVIDTAPVLPVSDTLLLAGKVQTVVLVVKACKTPRESVDRAIQLLKNVKAPIGGTLLNFLPNRRFLDYNYYGDSKGYGHYGRRKTGEESQAWWRRGFLKGGKKVISEAPVDV